MRTEQEIRQALQIAIEGKRYLAIRPGTAEAKQ